MIKTPSPDIEADDEDPTEFIISEVRKPIKALRNNKPIRKQSVDLSPHAESLRHLIAKADWKFRLTKDDVEPRLQGYKRKWLDNFVPGGQGVDGPSGPEYDYGDDSPTEEEMQRQWEVHYDDSLAKKGRGKPSTNQARGGGPPPIFLHAIYPLVRDWWELHTKTTFKPKFGGAPYDFEQFNAEARLLHLIVQECEPLYTLANTANLPRTLRDKRKKPNKKNRP